MDQSIEAFPKQTLKNFKRHSNDIFVELSGRILEIFSKTLLGKKNGNLWMYFRKIP